MAQTPPDVVTSTYSADKITQKSLHFYGCFQSGMARCFTHRNKLYNLSLMLLPSSRKGSHARWMERDWPRQPPSLAAGSFQR